MAYATVDEFESRWRTLTEDERAQAEVLLDDAAVMLDTLVNVDDSSETQLELLGIVSCAMVRRAMIQTASDTFGVSQETMTAGSYSQSMSFTNPTGDLYLTNSEKVALGIGGGYIGSIQPRIGGGFYD